MPVANNDTIPKATDTGTVTYLALGDSYTIGEAVPADENFPNRLTAVLKQNDYNILPPVIIARTGWTTNELIAAIKQKDIKEKFTMVTLLIGVNNQYRGYNIDTYRTEFVQLLNTALNYAGNNSKHVFVVSIPDYGVTPFASGSDTKKIEKEINAYNAIAEDEAGKAGVTFVDITQISRNALYDKALVAGDGLHPSGKMYSEWINKLAPVVAKHLNSK
ncbi:SGNH/GDSL hydrolase family protein [Mucilaginibacter gynuensis]|uniref:SGNH/GDSL hydrolase family protein n=2 Tax=Mucilaginibacter gynuensis TaxID=1302236 RepID=A0ABP8GVX2_9SPHI